MKKIINVIVNYFKFPYNHKTTIVKKFLTFNSKTAKTVFFKGPKVHLSPGKYVISCHTPDGYKIKYLKVHDSSLELNIKKFFNGDKK